MEPVRKSQKSFLEQPKLYTEDPVALKNNDSFNEQLFAQLNRQQTSNSKKKPGVSAENDHLYSSKDPLVRQTSATQNPLREKAASFLESVEVNSIFTADSKVNEAPFINSFYER